MNDSDLSWVIWLLAVIAVALTFGHTAASWLLLAPFVLLAGAVVAGLILLVAVHVWRYVWVVGMMIIVFQLTHGHYGHG